MAVRTTSSVAVLSALRDGATTVAEIMKNTEMTRSAVYNVLGRLRRTDPPQLKRTNKKGYGVEGTYEITSAGKKVLKKAAR